MSTSRATCRPRADDRQLDAVLGQREAALEPLVLGALDRAAPLEPRQHPLERRELEPAVMQASSRCSSARDRAQRPSASGAPWAISLGDAVHPVRSRRGRVLAVARERPPRAATSPTSSPTASRMSSGLDVVGALDPHRQVRPGQEEVERQRRRRSRRPRRRGARRRSRRAPRRARGSARGSRCRSRRGPARAATATTIGASPPTAIANQLDLTTAQDAVRRRPPGSRSPARRARRAASPRDRSAGAAAPPAGSGSLSAHSWYPASPACSPATMNGSIAGSTTSGNATE